MASKRRFCRSTIIEDADMQEKDETIYCRFLERRSEDDLRLLLERHRESLTLFINGIVHDLDDAEELMLDAFAVAASGTSRFSGKSSFRTWLFAIARKLALSRIRRRRLHFQPRPKQQFYSFPISYNQSFLWEPSCLSLFICSFNSP